MPYTTPAVLPGNYFALSFFSFYHGKLKLILEMKWKMSRSWCWVSQLFPQTVINIIIILLLSPKMSRPARFGERFAFCLPFVYLTLFWHFAEEPNKPSAAVRSIIKGIYTLLLFLAELTVFFFVRVLFRLKIIIIWWVEIECKIRFIDMYVVIKFSNCYNS